MSLLSRHSDPNAPSGKSSSAGTKGDTTFRQFRLGLIVLAPILVVTALVAFFPPDGNERAEWTQFIGRFHPLVIHFPIALFLLVPILELAGRSAQFSYLRSSASFVLGLATVAATAASLLGWCLGRTGGYSGALITQHMWGGILLTLICWLCWLLRAEQPGPGLTYVIALVLGVGLVSFTGYRGGQLSLGKNHLTEHMPAELRHVLGVENTSLPPAELADPNTFYGARIQPILAARCVNCHSADKHKGDLRLDSYRGLARGGKNGPAVLAGNLSGSDLFRRITLPANHDDFMPKGKAPLSADQVKVIELWIGAGASDTLAVDAIKNVPAGFAAPAAEVSFEEIDPAAVVKLRSAIAPAVAQLQNQYPNILDYDSRGSADLRLNASLLASKFGDKDLEAFVPVAEHVSFADLSRTAITDHSATAIAAMKHLRVLRLANTSLTDATLSRLGAMDQLESLNVFGTHATSAILPTIAKLPKLAHFYAGQTAIPPRTVPQLLLGKLCFLILGKAVCSLTYELLTELASSPTPCAKESAVRWATTRRPECRHCGERWRRAA